MSSISLSQFAEQLKHAAGAGAGKIATSVNSSGNILAKTGVVGPEAPGIGLQSILAAHHGGAQRGTSAQVADLPKIADHMAADALRQGAELLGGGQ